MAVLLKHLDKDVYIKSIDWVSGKVDFTDNPGSAKHYSSDWFANAEKSQLQHYASMTYDEGGLAEDYTDIIPNLVVHFT